MSDTHVDRRVKYAYDDGEHAWLMVVDHVFAVPREEVAGYGEGSEFTVTVEARPDRDVKWHVTNIEGEREETWWIHRFECPDCGGVTRADRTVDCPRCGVLMDRREKIGSVEDAD